MPRTIVITGCSSGIGLELAKQLAAAGYRLFCTVRTRAGEFRLAMSESHANAQSADTRGIAFTS